MWQYQEIAESIRKKWKRSLPRPESRSRKILRKEGNSSAGGDQSPGSNTQRPRKTSENLRACLDQGNHN